MSNPYSAPSVPDTAGSARHLSELIKGDVRTLQIVTGALAQGAVFFGLVATFVGDFDLNKQPTLLSWVGVGIAVLIIMLYTVVPVLVLRLNLSKVDRVAYASASFEERVPLVTGPLRAAHTVGCALLEGAAFANLVMYVLNDWVGNLAVAVVLVVMILLKMPTVSSFSHRIESVMQEMEL